MDGLDFPPPTGWRRAEPESLGFDSADLARACNHAESSEIDWPVDVGGQVCRDDPPPFNRLIGPVKPRGPASGIVVKDGLVAAEWGTPDRVDMTFSATKSYLWACVALALDRGLIRAVDDHVADYVDGAWFDTPQNRQVTWRHLLQQTSEWSGTLFGIPDSVDHNRGVNALTQSAPQGQPRRLRRPGGGFLRMS